MKYALLAGAVASAAAPAAFAPSHPGKPIRLLVGFTPAGGVDIIARLFGPKSSEYLGQQIIVENRPSAGTAEVVKASGAKAN